ncbi:hypothetical protein HanXRQr2_Chr14g0655241 [Helianthus annuus]|uniref:Uncharacterized protein n=1 Tax=Helianthus annuus TaxID=4232 RepID=A0A9K3EBB1_HELAN|nr:hypothetical protein HanXRQr2_Chr14g0655241 [Helianthus annuus]KAJ0465004.1 hypothetical protein HanHA300_Chr14g0533591 [Helianthus annuus]KAJ0486597.1 hypothetical protein HanHA89_Chr14g0581411 [Helianthus annuus]KAJ0657163.1 hypothetical protein HanLR1_Chr14g0543991 [Helianthus annuus]KAJ0660740.1 hypothetical protein HanOQP8_Chr14g0541091 [Helianthus annuus]
MHSSLTHLINLIQCLLIQNPHTTILRKPEFQTRKLLLMMMILIIMITQN